MTLDATGMAERCHMVTGNFSIRSLKHHITVHDQSHQGPGSNHCTTLQPNIQVLTVHPLPLHPLQGPPIPGGLSRTGGWVQSSHQPSCPPTHL
jgi:hypothetical protein